MRFIGQTMFGLVVLSFLSLTAPTGAQTAPASTSDASAASVVEATIDGGKNGQPISPYIYGQFIEHLGRCIYGGIWAEMLEDRKFYFPITGDYHPYRDLTESKFPVVGASPWEIQSRGDGGSVSMVKNAAFVGEHTPRITPNGGIRQNDLGLVGGKKYVGYIWLRAEGDGASAAVSLVWGEGDADKQTVTIAANNREYQKYPFEFTAGAGSEKGRLAIAVSGATCFVGTVSLMPADNVNGMRPDTLALLKQLNATMYRWPGGNFVSGYDWRDGIGPRDKRPPRRNPAWTGVEHNDVGIDEFIVFCREVGAEPVIAVNAGFGDDYSAAQEVEYVNGSGDTIGGSWRVKNGNVEPFNVKYWCVGNEMWGNFQLGYMSIRHYTQKHNRIVTAMRKVDPSLKFVGVGDLGTITSGGGRGGGGRGRRGGGETRNWSQDMLESSGNMMHYISEHFYSGTQMDDIPRHVAQIVDSIRRKAEGHRRLQMRPQNADVHVVPIAMDEWNYWFNPYVYGELGCVYQLRDALGIAAGLHEYYRNSDIIEMAHYAQTVNVIGCIKTTKTDAFFDATALPLMLYRREFGTMPLAVSTKNPEGRAIDVMAARTADGTALTVGAVNPHAQPQKVRLKLTGLKAGAQATVWRIAGDDPKAFNTVDNKPVTIKEEKSVPFGEEITLPPYSVNLYRVPLN
ncbi:MAG: alpha-L-arabinofuranosidase C-terminal domain-containing protein [Pirellulales bacterium]